jgi:8-oxo-dGTP pyrophosphatase MutT (NUDIX family)
VKLRDAATLMILRDGREVLLGARSPAHVFMPDLYVFPGGGVDAEDEVLACPVQLRPDVESKLRHSVSPRRARALALAAIRETFEETGLVVGDPATHRMRAESDSWRRFAATGFVPALDRLDYVARAITPAGQPRRFDARFFLVDARHAHGTLAGNGELHDLRWVALEGADRLAMGPITRLVLEVLRHRLTESPGDELADRVPLYNELIGRELIEHH